MRAMQIIEWGEPLEARDYPDPEPQGEEVLLRVEAAGVCHSDVHIWDGHFDLGDGKQISLASRGVALPFTMGHEIAGEVVALGPNASGVRVGDKVVAYPWIGCGECAVCQKGEELLCLNPRTLGTRRAGGYGSHVIVPHGRYLLPHDGIAQGELFIFTNQLETGGPEGARDVVPLCIDCDVSLQAVPHDIGPWLRIGW